MEKKRKAERKKRVLQHIMEDGSYQIVKDLLPAHWVVRDFNRPDYGIDLVIELFDSEGDAFVTLGEFLFVQVKSVKKAELGQKKIYPVGNVAKSAWEEDKSKWIDLAVVKYDMETDFLYTVQMQGASLAVLLFLVDLSTKECYFVCVNDYIDKYLMPSSPGYTEQDDVRVYIPACNVLSNKEFRDHALSLYGKRAKLLAAFSLFVFQKNEFQNFFQIKTWPVTTYRDQLQPAALDFSEFVRMTVYFLIQIHTLDIWQFDGWPVLKMEKMEIDAAKAHFDQSLEELEKDRDKCQDMVLLLWHRLTNLNNMYEEITREVYLPKFIGLLTGPNPPDVVEDGGK